MATLRGPSASFAGIPSAGPLSAGTPQAGNPQAGTTPAAGNPRGAKRSLAVAVAVSTRGWDLAADQSPRETKRCRVDDPTATAAGVGGNTMTETNQPSPFAATPPATPLSSPTTAATTPAQSDNGEEEPEPVLRQRAIAQMTRASAGMAPGTPVRPPAFYQRNGAHRQRPRAWILDWVTGAVRPRRMMDDFVDGWGEEKRRRWIDRLSGGEGLRWQREDEDADVDEEGED